MPASLSEESRRSILMVEPILFHHTAVYLQSMLLSDALEGARLTLAIGVAGEKQKARAQSFATQFPELRVIIWEEPEGQRGSAVQRWRANRTTLARVEELLGSESFDLLIYFHTDYLYPWFALPGAQARLPHHFRLGTRGLVFRENGYRDDDPRMAKRLRAMFDRVIFRRAVRSGGFARLAFLDPLAGEKAGKALGPVCRAGVDPISLEKVEPSFARQQLDLPPEGVLYLLFGALSHRKGVLETLEAFEKATIPNAILLLAGTVEREIAGEMAARLERLGKRYEVILHDRFVSDESVPWYFCAADVVVCAYKDFNGSSGVLLHTAASGRAAVVSEGGVMSDAIRRYQFGEVVRVEEPDAFARALERLADPAVREGASSGALAYAGSMDARHFLGQFL